ncbi:MAG: hypothetical protein ACLFWH_05320 [Actinomycetota bacterium]
MTRSPFHRGDYRRARRSITIAMVELEALEPRMQLAYKHDEIPASVVADLSLARLMVEELDRLLRGALDIAISDTGKYHDVYADATYDHRRLAETTEGETK